MQVNLNRMKQLKLLLTVAVISLFSGCDLFEYHPYDGRISGEKHINAKNISRIEEICRNKDTIRFIMTGDTQRCYDETADFVSAVNRRNDIDFIIHGGDVADFGLTKEFLWMRDILEGLQVPYVVILGNHDCLANGEEVFNEIFGKENFAFQAGDVKFVCLNTNALEYDYSHPVPDFQFLAEQYADSTSHKRTIFAMHVRPFSEQFNNNIAYVFQLFIKKFPGLMFCLNAHDHQISSDDLFDDGILYYGSPNIEKRKYLVFTITPDSYHYEVAEF